MVLAVAISPPSMHSTPSRRSSLRNLGSRSARARMVSLKSRVRAMVVLLFSPFIILPAVKSGLEVLLLAFLGAGAEQNDEAVSVLAEINAAAGSEIDAALEHSGTDALDVREVALRQTGQRRCHLGGSLRTQAVEPGRVR